MAGTWETLRPSSLQLVAWAAEQRLYGRQHLRAAVAAAAVDGHPVDEIAAAADLQPREVRHIVEQAPLDMVWGDLAACDRDYLLSLALSEPRDAVRWQARAALLTEWAVEAEAADHDITGGPLREAGDACDALAALCPTCNGDCTTPCEWVDGAGAVHITNTSQPCHDCGGSGEQRDTAA